MQSNSEREYDRDKVTISSGDSETSSEDEGRKQPYRSNLKDKLEIIEEELQSKFTETVVDENDVPNYHELESPKINHSIVKIEDSHRAQTLAQS